MSKVLEVRNLTKYYGIHLGIKDISFELNEGEIFGFIGPNGAGKSTTIRTILNLINKTSGTVLFKNKYLKKDNIELKKEIGYLPSEVKLYDDLTVREMLDFHSSFFNTNMSSRRKELLRRLRLDERKKVSDLSLGNLKKLGIILALVHKPKLLILDEPTSGLDPIIQNELYNILLEEKKKGTTIFYSTHILSEISKICDRVGIVKEGKLLKVESINELINKNFSYVTINSKDCKKIIKELNIEEDIIDDTIKFKSMISANELIETLSKYDIEKIYIEQASIEDIFLHYYK